MPLTLTPRSSGGDRIRTQTPRSSGQSGISALLDVVNEGIGFVGDEVAHAAKREEEEAVELLSHSEITFSEIAEIEQNSQFERARKLARERRGQIEGEGARKEIEDAVRGAPDALEARKRIHAITSKRAAELGPSEAVGFRTATEEYVPGLLDAAAQQRIAREEADRVRAKAGLTASILEERPQEFIFHWGEEVAVERGLGADMDAYHGQQADDIATWWKIGDDQTGQTADNPRTQNTLQQLDEIIESGLVEGAEMAHYVKLRETVEADTERRLKAQATNAAANGTANSDFAYAQYQLSTWKLNNPGRDAPQAMEQALLNAALATGKASDVRAAEGEILATAKEHVAPGVSGTEEWKSGRKTLEALIRDRGLPASDGLDILAQYDAMGTTLSPALKGDRAALLNTANDFAKDAMKNGKEQVRARKDTEKALDAQLEADINQALTAVPLGPIGSQEEYDSKKERLTEALRSQKRRRLDLIRQEQLSTWAAEHGFDATDLVNTRR